MAQAPINGKGSIGPTEPTPGAFSSGQEEEGHSFESIAKAMPSTPVAKPSPMNVAQSSQPSMQTGEVNAESLVANMQQVLNQMQGLQMGLKTPNLKLNARQSRLLDTKLKRTKDHLSYVRSKANVGEEGDQEDPNAKKVLPVADKDGKDKHPAAIIKFLSYITDGQSQLESAMHGVNHMHSSKKPGLMMHDLFAMQVKLYRAQVEIEFSTAVLQKAIDDLKTMMTVQL